MLAKILLTSTASHAAAVQLATSRPIALLICSTTMLPLYRIPLPPHTTPQPMQDATTALNAADTFQLPFGHRQAQAGFSEKYNNFKPTQISIEKIPKISFNSRACDSLQVGSDKPAGVANNV